MKGIHTATRTISSMAIVFFALSSSNIAAQISTDNRGALSKNGYTTNDFKAAEVTQIGSNYPLYKAFSNCFQQAANAIVMNNITDSRAQILISQCQDEGLNLRASIARTLGLQEATRVVSMIAFDFGLNLRKRMQAQNGPMSNGSTRVGIWSIVKASNRQCMAFVNAESYVDDVRFYINDTGIGILIKTDFQQPAIGKPTKDQVTIGHYPAPTPFDGQFSVVELSGKTWLGANLSNQDMRYVNLGGTIDIEQNGTGRIESREVGGSFNDVLGALKRCFQ